jgi:hypothetical protein
MGGSFKLVRVEDNPSFFKKHARFISFVGALIVFLTFVVKENLLESWKSTAGAYETALSIYSIRADTSLEQSHFDILKHQIELLDKSTPDPEMAGIPRLFTSFFPHDIEARTEQIKAELDAIEVLVEKLPKEGGDRAQLAALRTDLAQVTQYNEDIKKLQKVPDDPAKRQVWQVQTSVQFLKKTMARNKLLSGDDGITEKTKTFSQSVLGKAKDVRKKNEERAEYAKWVGVFLYVVGWGLGLAGSIFGRGEPLGEA